jgi:hypothetical protein
MGPANDPSIVTAQLHGGVIRTEFLDDLYVKSRTAGVSTLTISGVFE